MVVKAYGNRIVLFVNMAGKRFWCHCLVYREKMIGQISSGFKRVIELRTAKEVVIARVKVVENKTLPVKINNYHKKQSYRNRISGNPGKLRLSMTLLV